MRSFQLWTASLALVQISAPYVSGANQDYCQAAADEQMSALGDQVPERLNDILYLAPLDPELAYQCLTSVPLYTDEASEMIDYIKSYWSFQSTVPYLKDPPASYQQPAVDLMGRLDDIASKLDDGAYNNQYEFDLDILAVLGAAHEGHMSLSFGTMGIFRWLLPETIVSVSSDGQEIPQIYAYSDIYDQVDNASPIVEFEGESVFTYLRKYIETMTGNGNIEAHTDFNVLMPISAAMFANTGSGTSDTYSSFGLSYSRSYNGASLTGRFANATKFEWKYTAGSWYNLTEFSHFSGQDIYDILIRNGDSSGSQRRDLRPTKASRSLRADGTLNERSTSSSTTTSVPYPNYPDDPVVIESNFGSGGTVSGYLLKDDSIGVLSLPTFSTDHSSFESLTTAVGDFIAKAKKAGMKKIVIDVQGNGGGSLFAGYDTFKQFFPNKEPLELYRSPASRSIDTFGTFISGALSDDESSFTEDQKSVIEFLYGNNVQLNTNFAIKPDQTSWKSWDDFFGPEKIHGTNYTLATTYNLSSSDLNPIATYRRKLDYDEPPWAADDIVLLTDGMCASTCHTLQMFLKNDAGVKTIVVGGIPEYGPMQGVAGTRGGSVQPWELYSNMTRDFQNFMAKGNSTVRAAIKDLGVTDDDFSALPATIDKMPWQASPSINTIDIVRPESEDVPRQFLYEAADCRVFYTPEMYRDITQLWLVAGKYANGDKSVCVPGSTNAPGSQINNTLLDSPGFSYNDTWDNANSTKVPNLSKSSGGGAGGNSGHNAGMVTNRVSVATVSLVVFSVAFFLL